MTPQLVYVPIVKGKMNDVKALGKLSSDVRVLVKPLIETMPFDHETQMVDRHVYRFVNHLINHFPLGEAFIDFYGLLPDDRLKMARMRSLRGLKC